MTRHSVRAGAVLRGLVETDPAMAALSLWCDHRDGHRDEHRDGHRDGDSAVVRTTGSTITYGPGFDGLPRHEQTGVAAHHILHVALRHSRRMDAMAARWGDGFDAELYAIAADAVVNEALVQVGYAIPRPALTLTGLLADLNAAAPAVEALAKWDVDRLYIWSMQGGGRQAAKGTRAHVKALVFAPDLDADVQKAAPAEAAAEALWRQHLARAMEAGRLAGRGIGVLGHRLADLAAPETPWEVVLRGLVTRALTEGARGTYRRPARRWLAMEADAWTSGGPAPDFQPGQLRGRVVLRVVVALDASSSIDEARLAMFVGEVAGIVRRMAAEFWVIAFDEAPRVPVRLDAARWRGQLAALGLPRGGGTSFAGVIAAAARLQPSVIVVLTDLEGEVGAAPRGVPVIWAVPDATVPQPAYGRVLSLAR